MDLSNIDPNAVVGWLAVLGVTAGALWKVGRWILDLRGDIAKAIEMMDTSQRTLTRHERMLVYIMGHLSLDLKKIMDSDE